MNAFSSSLKTFIFSLLFATLLALTAAHPPSSGEEIAEQEEKNIASPDELIVRFLKIEKSYKNK